MKQLQAMTASVMYQGVSVAQNVNLLHLDTEKAGLAMDAPLPVATELTLELSFSGDAVRGSAIVTRVQESRASDEKGQMHVRWVEFSDPDLERLSRWIAETGDSPSTAPAPAAPVAAQPDVTLPMHAPPVENGTMAPEEKEMPVPTESSPPAIPSPSDEEERTVPLDTATQVDIPALTDSVPSVEEENSANAGEETSPSPGGENGDAEGGDKKKRRRRKK